MCVCVCVRQPYVHVRVRARAHTRGVMCARREEDPISTTLKVITLIKAVMCGDGRAEEEEWGAGGAIFYGAVWGPCDLRDGLGGEGKTGKETFGVERKLGVREDKGRILLWELGGR